MFLVCLFTVAAQHDDYDEPKKYVVVKKEEPKKKEEHKKVVVVKKEEEQKKHRKFEGWWRCQTHRQCHCGSAACSCLQEAPGCLRRSAPAW